MEWVILFFAIAALTAAMLISRSEQTPAKDAGQHLRGGGLLIDVRTPSEFAVAHLPGAVNIPLTSITWLVPARVRDRNRVLLLHGTVGLRGAFARNRLQALGYANVFNLGSYDRAAQIAEGNQPQTVWSDAARSKRIEEALLQKETSRRPRFGTTVRVNS